MESLGHSDAGVDENGIHRWSIVSVCFLLAAAVIGLYSRTLSHSFINLDDFLFVRDNTHIQQGLTLHGIQWAFTNWMAGLWKPLTWISYMLDIELFGMDAGRIIFMNAVYHAISSVLFFLVLLEFFRRMKSAPRFWTSAAIAVVFAIHPLRVESVAWAAERKDVLSVLFWLLTLLAYLHYVKRPALLRYVMIAVPLLLGLMAKPTIVTLPCVLLLLDFWPLGRVSADDVKNPKGRRKIGKLLLEKTPLLAASLILSLITFMSAAEWVSGKAPGDVTFSEVFSLTIVSFPKYILLLFRPIDLSVIYPRPQDALPFVQVLGAALMLVAITVVALRQIRKRPWFAVGWFWFIGTLLPTTNLFIHNPYWIANRYTYIPHIGLLMIVGQFLAEWVQRLRISRTVVAVSTAAVTLTFMVLTWSEIGAWKSTETLFSRVLQTDPDHPWAHKTLGAEAAARGMHEEAIRRYARALAVRPDDASTLGLMAGSLAEMGEFEAAFERLRRALKHRPGHPNILFQYGTVLARSGADDEAVRKYTAALDVYSRPEIVHFQIGSCLLRQKKYDAAIEHFSKAVELSPFYASAHEYLGTSYYFRYLEGWKDDLLRAQASCQQALALDPESAQACRTLGTVYEERRLYESALEFYGRAVEVEPDDVESILAVGRILYKLKRNQESIAAFRSALRVDPGHVIAHESLCVLYTLAGEMEAARDHFEAVEAVSAEKAAALQKLIEDLKR